MGSSNLIDLTIEGTKEPFIVLVQEVQRDLIKQRITHFDLRQIKMGEEMTATITLNLIGESVAVKELGGTLSTPLNSLNVKCLPKDLVSDIEVDISVLATFDDAVYIKDIKLPEGITVTDNVDTLIAKVVAPLTEEQLKALEEAEAAPVEEIAVEGEEGVEEGAEEGEKEGEEKKEEGAEE